MAVLLLCRNAGLAKRLVSRPKILLYKEYTVFALNITKNFTKKRNQEQWRSFSLAKYLYNDKSSLEPQKTDIEPVPESKKIEDAPLIEEVDDEDLYKEKYIPITRRSVIRQLVDEKDFLSSREKKLFEEYASKLDTAIVNKYHGVLQDVKALFDPINPDKDTIQTRKWNRRDKLDNEFWLLQRLEDILEKANFHELSEATLQKAMEEHDVSEGVRVSIDRNKFDVLRIWALGKEQFEINTPWYKKFMFWKPPPPKEKGRSYYKRVVIGIRMKKDQKLMLKAFKEVPTNSLEMLIPDGKIMINKTDKGLVALGGFLALSTILAKGVTVLAKLNVDWILTITIVAGFVGIRALTVYNNRKNRYLADLNRLLYWKNVANNRGLLALLVDRAEDESFKEALLTYTFLLANRTPKARRMAHHNVPDDLGNITDLQLEKKVEEWIQKKAGVSVEFDSSEAVSFLKDFGLLSVNDGIMNVMPLEQAMLHLPLSPQTRVDRMDEDLIEGYDRDYFLETEEHYKEEEVKSKQYGWH